MRQYVFTRGTGMYLTHSVYARSYKEARAIAYAEQPNLDHPSTKFRLGRSAPGKHVSVTYFPAEGRWGWSLWEFVEEGESKFLDMPDPTLYETFAEADAAGDAYLDANP